MNAIELVTVDLLDGGVGCFELLRHQGMAI